jgi:hypothetical protein
MVESLSFSSKEKEIDLKDFSKNLQSELTDTTAVFNQLLKERMQDTPAAGAETGDIGVFSGELDKLYQEASTVALDNKLELISEHVGQPVINSDLSNMQDLALVFDMSRSGSFTNRKKKFYNYYPDGEFIRQQVTIGDRTMDLELFKYNKNDKEYKMVDGFGMNYSDFAEVMGQVMNAQLVGEGIGLFAGSAIGQPMAGVTIGSYLGLKGDKLIEYMRGYGEDEFAGGFDMGQFFTDTDDLFSAAISGGLFKATQKVGDYLFLGKRPGTIELTPTIVQAAEKLGLDPLVFAQLAVNPQIRNIFTQAEGFTSYVPDTKQKQIDSIIESFKSGKNPFTELDPQGALKFDIQDLLNAQTKLANDAKKYMKVNFDIKDGVASLGEADQALAGIIKNFNSVNKKFQNKYLNGATKAAQESGDFSVNLKGFNQVMMREINDMLSGVRVKDKVTTKTINKVKTKIIQEGGDLKQSYKSINDLPTELKNIAVNIKRMGNGFNVTKDKNMLNYKTLYNMREDLHKLMHNEDPKISMAAQAMHKSLLRVLDPKNGFIKGSDDFMVNAKILNSQVTNAEVVNGMNMMREAFLKGNDLDGFVKTMIRPSNTNNIAAIQQMLKLPDDASQADKKVSEKFFNTLKNYWLVSTAKSDDGAKILDEFMLNDPDSLKILMGPNYEQKVTELQKLMELSNKVENGIVNQAISQKATAKEFTNKIITNAKKGDFGTANNTLELIEELGGFDSKLVNDIRNNIMKDLFEQSFKIQDKPGKKMLQEVLDVQKFADNIKKLREDENLVKFFNGDQLEALTSYEQYSRAVGGNLGVGGELAKAEQTSQLVQKFNVLDTGLTILKYNVLARILSTPVTAKSLKALTPDGFTSNNLKVLQTALIGLEREAIDNARGYNKFEDQGIVNEYEIKPKEMGQMAPTPNISFDPSPVNQVSRLANANIANPVGMMPTATADTGAINPNTMARGQQLFGGPGEITFAAEGGIMNARKPIQRVA